MTEPTNPAPDTGAATPGAPAKKPRVRRTGTSIERALDVVRGRPSVARNCVETMNVSDPVAAAEANLRFIESECDERLAAARAVRDFAREIAGLNEDSRAMLRTGIERIAKAKAV